MIDPQYPHRHDPRSPGIRYTPLPASSRPTRNSAQTTPLSAREYHGTAAAMYGYEVTSGLARHWQRQDAGPDASTLGPSGLQQPYPSQSAPPGSLHAFVRADTGKTDYDYVPDCQELQ